MKTMLSGLAALLLAAVLAGCATPPTLYIRPNADLSLIRTVAVLPFETTQQDRTAAEKVQKIFISELLSYGIFEVVEPGIVLRGVKNERIDTATMNAADIKKLGEALGAQALIFGTVIDFAETRLGSTPVPQVTIQLRLVDTESGATFWSVSQSRGGAGILTRLFGVNTETPTEAAQRLIQQEIGTILIK